MRETFDNAVKRIAKVTLLKMEQKKCIEAKAVVAGGFLGEGRVWMEHQEVKFLQAMVDKTDIQLKIGHSKEALSEELVDALIAYKNKVMQAAKKMAEEAVKN